MMQCPVCGTEVQPTEQGLCPTCSTALTDLDVSTPEAPTARPAALLAGTLVRDRYTILNVLASGDDRVVYLATDGGNVRRCLLCGVLTQGVDSEFCEECGAELSAGRYRVTEWWTEDDFAGLDALTRSGLAHEGWLTPIDWFVWDGRRYMAQVYVEGQSLQELTRPFDLHEVLAWGISLGEVLQMLHTNGFAGLSLSPEDLVMTADRRVKLADFQDVAVYPGGPLFLPETVMAARQQDIQSLGTILLLLIDGHETPDPIEAPEVDLALQTLLTRIVAQEYSDVQTVLDELRALLPGVPVSAPSVVPGIAASRQHTLHYLVGSRSDIGRVRKLNEDTLVTLDFSTIRESKNETVGVYIVADGIGGHDRGEVASRIAVGAILHHLIQRVFQPILDGEEHAPDGAAYASLLKDAFRAANEAIIAVRQQTQTDMGATATAALVVGSLACVANIGDSRTYLLRQGRLVQLTIDHSVVARLVTMGMARPDDVYTHPQRNQIYRAIVGDRKVEIDTFVHTLLPGDCLVLCSDGLWGMVRDGTMETILREAASPQDACDTLVRMANEHGGEDNITVIVVQAVEYER